MRQLLTDLYAEADVEAARSAIWLRTDRTVRRRCTLELWTYDVDEEGDQYLDLGDGRGRRTFVSC